MDTLLSTDGRVEFKISVAGIEPATGRVQADTFALSLYAYDLGPPVRALFTAQLDLDQARGLYSYLHGITMLRDPEACSAGPFLDTAHGIPEEVIESLLSDPNVIRMALKVNPEVTRSIIELELDAIEIQSLGYKKHQLEQMRRLVHDPEYFEARRAELEVPRAEDVWQRFFESNQWIFGFALNYVIGEGVNPERLEQVVAGHSIAGAGKRTDALLRTRGIVRSLCYVEIKTHDTPLLANQEYRPEVWRPSIELCSAIAQVQKTVQLAMEDLRTKLELPEPGGLAHSTYYNYCPRAIVVCGMLSQFVDGNDVDVPRFSSFEIFRRSVDSPEIVTFDELLERAEAIVQGGMESRGGSKPAGSALDTCDPDFPKNQTQRARGGQRQ